jgi:hypothetical protein
LTIPLEIVQLATAPEPLPPVISIDGVAVYPEPPFDKVILKADLVEYK